MTTRHLGATYVEYSVLTSDWDEQSGFLQGCNIYIEASLKLLLRSLLKTQCHQYWQTGNFGNDKPARTTSSSRLNISWIFQDQSFCQVRALKSHSNELFFTIFFYEKPMSANWLWGWPIDPNFLEEGNDKDLRMFRCPFLRIIKPEHNLSNLFLCLFFSISLPWINPS